MTINAKPALLLFFQSLEPSFSNVVLPSLSVEEIKEVREGLSSFIKHMSEAADSSEVFTGAFDAMMVRSLDDAACDKWIKTVDLSPYTSSFLEAARQDLKGGFSNLQNAFKITYEYYNSNTVMFTMVAYSRRILDKDANLSVELTLAVDKFLQGEESNA